MKVVHRRLIGWLAGWSIAGLAFVLLLQSMISHLSLLPCAACMHQGRACSS